MASPKVSPILAHPSTSTQTIESLIAVCSICKHDVHTDDLCECFICGGLYCGKGSNDCKGCACEDMLNEFGANVASPVNDEGAREAHVQEYCLPDKKYRFDS